MNYRAIAEELLARIGVVNLDPADDLNTNVANGRGLNVDRDLPAVVTCINGGLQEAYTLCPSNLIERQVGDVLRPAEGVTLTVTQYSPVISSLTTFASWMLGCSIRMEGDEIDNRIVSQTELARPYLGTSGSGKAATVYADCIAVPSTYCAVVAPVEISTRRGPLRMCSTREEFILWNNPHVTNRQGWILYGGYPLHNKTIGEPVASLADWESLGGTTQPKLYLRFNPMPDRVYSITYTARLAPPTITLADIWASGTPTVDPGVPVTLPLPEGILLSICLQRWSSNPSFQAEGSQLQEIARQYKEAKAMMLKRPAQYAASRVDYRE